jgi:hypothetical protein
MFRFSASKRPVQAEEIQDVLKTWGKLALAGIFVAGSLVLPKAFADNAHNYPPYYNNTPVIQSSQPDDLGSILGNIGGLGNLGGGVLGNYNSLPTGIKSAIAQSLIRSALNRNGVTLPGASYDPNNPYQQNPPAGVLSSPLTGVAAQILRNVLP